jgi:hypothetical protein
MMMKRRRDFAKEAKKIRGYYNKGQYQSSTSNIIVEEAKMSRP